MRFNLTKRQKIIITTIILTIGLLSTQLVDFNLRFKFIAGLAVLSGILSLWALWEGLNFTKAVVLLILPVFFTAALSSFYFLLPIRWLTRLPVAGAFGLMFYLLLLAQNVFNVAAIRSISLYRAASTASFLFTLLSAFFIFNVIYALELLFLWNGVVVWLVSFPLILQSLWAVNMEDKISLPIAVQSIVISFVVGELAIVFSFWPVDDPVLWSLPLATSLYMTVGLTFDYLNRRLRKNVLADYLFIGIIILIGTYLLTPWAGKREISVAEIIGILGTLSLIYFILIRRKISDKVLLGETGKRRSEGNI